MKRVWYIKIEKEPEGPFSVDELRWDTRLTPDTLAWRNGMSTWLPIRQIPELASLFEKEKSSMSKKAEGGEKVLTLNSDPQQLYYGLIALALFILILIYFFYL